MIAASTLLLLYVASVAAAVEMPLPFTRELYVNSPLMSGNDVCFELVCEHSYNNIDYIGINISKPYYA
jgi:hypothetical protein